MIRESVHIFRGWSDGIINIKRLFRRRKDTEDTAVLV
jgi:hypothetical protein